MTEDMAHSDIFIQFKKLAVAAVILKQRMVKFALINLRHIVNKTLSGVRHQLI
ncbi:hypothetical protein D3C78_1788790 [compost metagenome]